MRDVEKFGRDAGLLQMDLRHVTRQMTEDTATVAFDVARATAPGMDSTGALRNSITKKVFGRNSFEVSAGEGLDRDYARFQEFGYAPHTIKTSWSHNIRDPDAKGGMLVSKFTPFMGPATQASARLLDSQLQAKITSTIRRTTG